MQRRSPPFWLMIVSRQIAVLPVARSPMMSSRCPLPIGTIESMAFTPVCTGTFTPCLAATPGAMTSTVAVSLVATAPLASIGAPSASTTLPSMASPTGTSMTRPVPRTSEPSFTASASPRRTAPTPSSSRFSAMPVTPPSNSRSSFAPTPDRPCARAMPSPTSITVPTSTIVSS